jgi:hypothetical protein
MLQVRASSHAAPTVITPECHARGCSVSGDQYTMVRCRRCDAWFCPDHIDPAEGVRLVTHHRAPLVGLTVYIGICRTCRTCQHQRHALTH